jgi:transcriptional regulator with XRE-family HTH domain
MIIGERLRLLRESKGLSQGAIEGRTGLLRCYISRVENGHTVPAVETLEKFAHALETPLYQLLYDGPQPPRAPTQTGNLSNHHHWGAGGKDFRYLSKLRQALSKMSPHHRSVLMAVAAQIAREKKR